jgi:hypothetical protein
MHQIGDSSPSDRYVFALKDKSGVGSINNLLLERERKKSEISKTNIADLSSGRGLVNSNNPNSALGYGNGLEVNGVNCSVNGTSLGANNMASVINRYEASRSINNR